MDKVDMFKIGTQIMLEHVLEAERFLERGQSPSDYEHQLLKDNRRVEAILNGMIIPPYELEIQTTSLCNLRCLHCFGKDYGRIQPQMTVAQLKQLSEKIAEFVEDKYSIRVIKFCGTTGEPLVNPATIEGIKIFKAMGKEVICFTNGLWLDKTLPDGQPYYEVVGTVDKVNLSLDADCEETFKRLKGRQGFDKIIHSLEKLVASKPPQNRLIVSYVISIHNYQGIVSAAELLRNSGADELWFRVDFTDAEDIRGISGDIIDSLEKAKSYSSPDFKVMSVYSAEAISGNDGAFNSFGRKCFNRFFWACIGPDSNLYACGHRTHAGIQSYGSLLDHSFRELWERRQQNLDDLPDNHCLYCSPSSVRRNDFMTFLSQLSEQQRKQVYALAQ
ncbi:radical SAM protein [Candidatus Woesearchaeota archaeon]|nr:radical SAM protein [Candidatus Woesearchaeota archaeon]